MSDDYVFNPESGTVGRIQLVVRWVLFGNGAVWPRRHGSFTYADERHAREHAALCLLCSPDTVPPDLTHASFWCYPDGYYPAHRIDTL